ncbi:MAG: helix-turn-helix domain-containing protein [Treponema sp.]|nr:helix-turn-helix domain-containing protein [Treponema sp.]
MYNILLTDDEQIMIDSLKFIIEKNFPSETKLFQALSGSTALEIAAREQVDIIFMDINMPGLNGLETVKFILQARPETIIVILSAFDRFQYAQEAVNLGVYRYLTKPVNRNTVVETLRNAMNIVDQKRGRRNSEEELHKKLDIVSPMVESDFIYSAALSGTKDVSEYFSYFGISGSAWCFCCLEFPGMNEKKQNESYDNIRTLLGSRAKCITGSFMANRLATFFYFPLAGGLEKLENEAKDTLSSIYNILCLNISPGIRAGVSTFFTDPDMTGTAYNEALEALNSTPGEGGILFAGKAVAKRKDTDPGTIAEGIFGRIRAGDCASIRHLLNSYAAALQESYEGDMGKIKNAIFELLVNVRNITTEIDCNYQNDEFSSAFSVLSAADSMGSVLDFALKRCEECATDVMKFSSTKDNHIVKKAEDYIEKRMSEDLSLEDVAAAINVSPSYLSRMFKDVKGENYINYLTDMRLRRARELLRDPRMPIKEISAEIGFNDQNYFSRIFKNKFGMTPTEFRNVAK